MTEKEYLEKVDRLSYYERRYYVDGVSEIPDQEYDILYKEVQKIEREHPRWTASYSPTKRVGSDLHPDFTKKKHASPMRSIQNTYSLDQVKEWRHRIFGRRLGGRKKFPDGG